MHSREQYLDLIHDAIKALELPKNPAGLYRPITYALDCGGKRLRPTLALAAAEACGLAPELAINQALAVEIFHNFTLLHVDGYMAYNGSFTVLLNQVFRAKHHLAFFHILVILRQM